LTLPSAVAFGAWAAPLTLPRQVARRGMSCFAVTENHPAQLVAEEGDFRGLGRIAETRGEFEKRLLRSPVQVEVHIISLHQIGAVRHGAVN
jgi:hypothetical protein